MSTTIIHPTLHHFGLTTGRLQEMTDWYAAVLGMTPNLRTSIAVGPEGSVQVAGVWVTNDQANHRVALLALPGLSEDPDKRTHTRLQHVAFEYATLDDLLSTHERLQELGIEPVLSTDHGATTAFYYEDPDGNSVELSSTTLGTGTNRVSTCEPRQT